MGKRRADRYLERHFRTQENESAPGRGRFRLSRRTRQLGSFVRPREPLRQDRQRKKDPPRSDQRLPVNHGKRPGQLRGSRHALGQRRAEDIFHFQGPAAGSRI